MKKGILFTSLDEAIITNESTFGQRLQRLMLLDGIEIKSIKDACISLDNRLIDAGFREKIWEDEFTSSTKASTIENDYHTLKKYLIADSYKSLDMKWFNRIFLYFNRDEYQCSADYLLGTINSPTHEQSDICSSTGLSEKAVKELCDYQKEKNKNSVKSHMFGAVTGWKFEETISLIIEHPTLCGAIYDYLKCNDEIDYVALTDTGHPTNLETCDVDGFTVYTKNQFNQLFVNGYEINADFIKEIALRHLQESLDRVRKEISKKGVKNNGKH